MDIEFRSPDGNRLFTDLFLTRLDDAPGLMMVQAVSVTRHKETQIELVNAKRRIHLPADVAGMGFWEYDFASGIQNWDDGVFRIYGIRREDFSGRWDTYVHPGDLEQAEQAVRDTVRRGGSGEQRFRVLRPDGSVRHVHSIFTVERDGSGSPRSLTGVNFDITERVLAKESEERLDASLRVILDNLPIPVITSRTSGAGEITLLNQEFTRLLGYTLEDAPTIEVLIALNYPDPLEKARVVAWWRDLISQSRENLTPARGEPFLIRCKDGRFFDFLVNATVVGDTLIFASHDITARKQAEEIGRASCRERVLVSV
jgi:PAS domain S-box-containing protein